MKIAVLGLGAMGSRLAHRLLATGEHHLTIWNRTAQAVEPLVEAGAGTAATAALAVKDCDLVLSMVRDDHAGRDVWLAERDGALAGMAAGTIAIDCSTVTPAFSRELAARSAAQGVAFLDAPVVGSRPQADAGALIFLVGGDPQVLAQAEPVLRQLGAAIHHLGPTGSGTRMKLLVNALFAVQVAAVAELIGTLAGTDLDPKRAIEVLSATPVLSPAAAGAAAAMLADNFPAAFPIELVSKDLTYAAIDAGLRGAAVPLVTTTAETYQNAITQGYGADNITGVVQLFQPAAD